ncbi:MAG: transposase [Bacteroides sp.]|nr:transposase [Bacteroides sp.]
MPPMNTANRVLDELYFVTSTVADWIDIFTRPKYKHIILESLAYCQEKKGLRIYAWVLMSNHLHMIVSSATETPVSDILRDFKKFTSKRILAELEIDPQESRREWMLDRFQFAGANDKKISKHRFWQEGCHPELIYLRDFYMQKLNYIHNNPVRQEIVSRPEEYLYSSAKNYAGEKGALEVIVS